MFHPNTRSLTRASLAAILIALTATTVGCSASVPYVSEKYTAISTPQGFPKDIPVHLGDLVAAERIGSDGWSATLVLDGAHKEATLLDELEDRGFAVSARTENSRDGAQTSSVALTDKSHTLTVVFSRIGEMYLARFSYAVL